jgi:O6-methylguanine-DNA--protein-cysteine methyltransferase
MHYDQNLIVFKTPFGWAGVAVSDQGICAVVLPKKYKKAAERELKSSELGVRRSGPRRSTSLSVLGSAKQLLKKYFASERVSFDLPLDLRYYTTFQQAVWKAAAEIPYGETRSYGWIAKRIGNPMAVRAVGQAMGANPFPIIVP